MTILQHYYTSCEGKGFRTNAVSSNLDDDTIRFLERVGVYIPPLSLPSRPTEEEIKMFPVSLSYLLHGNRLVLSHSVYIGQDYTSRFGNYFSHSVVSDNYDEDIKNLLPIQLWGSPVWVAEESASTELPPLKKLEAGSFITWENVLGFLATNDRLPRLSGLLTAAIEGFKTKKRIIIVDSNQNIALWIAAMTRGLPRELAKEITFATYNKNPYSLDVLICGTTSDSDFHFSTQEIDYEYFVFDFEGNRFSEIKEIEPYAEVVCKIFSNREFGFFDIFSKFYSEVVSRAPKTKYELHSLFAMYSAISGIAISEAGWQKVLDLILSYDLLNLYPDLMINVISRLGNVPSAGKDLTFYAIDLYIKTSQEKVNPTIRYEAAKAFFNIVLLKYSPTATVSDWEVIREKTKNIRLEQLQEEYELNCIKLFQDTQDAKKKILLFQFFMTSGLITSKSKHLGRLLDNEIMPIITESTTQKLFNDCLSTDFRVPFITALGKYLSGADTKTITALSNLISNELIYNDLISFTIQQKNPFLYGALYGIYVQSKKEKVRLFLDFYKNLRTFKLQSNIALLEKAFSNTWGTSYPTFEETTKIVDGIAPDDLYPCTFADIFAEVVYKNTNFIEPAPNSIELAEELLNSTKLSKEHRAMLQIITEIPKLTGNSEDLETLYAYANITLFSDDDSLHKKILEHFYRKLIILNKQQKTHRDYVKKLLVLQKGFPIHYSAYRAAFNYAISDKSYSTNVFVDCFKVWDKLYSGNMVISGAKSDFLYIDYKNVFYSQKKKTRETIEKEICNDPHFKKRWELFKQKTERGVIVTINRNIKTLTDSLKKTRQKKKTRL